MCSINSWWGQTIVNCWSRSQLGMPCTGLWFNKPPGIRPCPLYTPPVALTDGLFCEFEGLVTICTLLYIFRLWKLKRTVWSKGKRSRNKASVGEPADGSLRFLHILLIVYFYSLALYYTYYIYFTVYVIPYGILVLYYTY